MTHVIRFHLPLFNNQKDDYPKVVSYLQGFQWPDRRAKPAIDWTPYLHQAIQYADGGAANCIKTIIQRKYPDAEVLTVSEKEIFKAKLADR